MVTIVPGAQLVARLSMALQRGNAHYVGITTRAWSRTLGVSLVMPRAFAGYPDTV